MNATQLTRSKVGRDAILRAAAEVFFERGYSATSIDAIIERTGGSKRNIYRDFGSKEGLFTAIVSDHAEKALAALSVEDNRNDDLRSTLTAFGSQLLDIYMSPALLGVYRIAVTENARFPTLVRQFYDQGPGRASAKLTEVLKGALSQQNVQRRDCAVAADHFVSMIRGNLHLQVVLGLRPPPDGAEAHALVTSAVDILLYGLTERSEERA